MAKHRFLFAYLCLWLCAVSCTPDKRVERAAHKVENSLQRAKDEAQQLKAKLPVPDAVKTELHEVAHDVENTLKTADSELSKTSAEAKAKIRKRVPLVSK